MLNKLLTLSSLLTLRIASPNNFDTDTALVFLQLLGHLKSMLSVMTNSSKALFYFAFGLPAFSLIKVFSSFYFARHNTKLPFYISLFSVLLNILVSVIFFKKVGFIIIPIATTISSWFNSILLFIFLKKDNFFNFNLVFISRFFRILFSSIIMGIIIYYLTTFFKTNLAYDQSFKSVFLIVIVLVGLISYLLIAFLIKAFKISDINLKY